MDFTGRNSQPSPAAPRPGTSFSADNGETSSFKGAAGAKRPKADFDLTPGSKWSRIIGGLVVIVVAVLIAAVLGFMMTTSDHKEGNLVNHDKYQAVFLTNDQVYFGKVSEINGKYLVLNKVYYLQTSGNNSNQTTQANSNVSLVKLGCELHKPYDQMVLNRDQVQFWENLQSDGQVGTAIKQFEDQNPNGQKCSTTPATNSPNVQGSTDTTNTDTNTNTSNTNTTTNKNTSADTNKTNQ